MMTAIREQRRFEYFPKDEPTRSQFRLIDLFCGAGGLSLGFRMASSSFRPVWANDIDEDAARTYNLNFGDHCEACDLDRFLAIRAREIPKADIVIGGPPCQGFSLLNKNRAHDARKQLWRPFLEVTERVGAEVFVMENVPQLLGSEEFEQIREQSLALGFSVAQKVLSAADYGVPQTRKRAIIVGCRRVDPREVFPPPPTHSKVPDGTTNVEPWRTVRDAIGDLPLPDGNDFRDAPPPLDLHFGRCPTELSVKRYKAIPDEGMNRIDLQRLAPELTPDCWLRKKSGGTDLFGRLWWDRPAFTIRTEFFKPEKGRYLHPVQHRPITHREAARLQSFPDDFRFTGSKISVARQIGNAVPPLLGRAVAQSVLSLLACHGSSLGG